MFKGIGASDGIGIGRVLKFVEKPVAYENAAVTDTAAEKERFGAAVESFIKINEQRADLMDKSGSDGEILRGHIAMLNDPYMLSQVNEMIESGTISEKAIETVCNMFIGVFSAADDELTRQRAADVEDIKKQMLKLLLGIEDISLKTLPPETVLIVEELTPSMTAEIDIKNIAGIVTEKGGRTSHSAIISRSLKIPAVLSVSDALKVIPDGADIIIDGSAGEVYTDFDESLRRRFNEMRESYAEKTKISEKYRGRKTVTADGAEKELYANIGSHKDLASVIDGDAEGIGLFRTEFLFMDRDSLPAEDEQFEAYKAVAVGMKGREVIIRTLDVGGDKDIPYLGLKKEDNPFLGFRAIRYCLKNSDIYKVQLRAILRASAYGNIAIMLPLITRADEVIKAKAFIEEIKKDFDDKKIPYKKDIRVGIMAETPAACLIADILAEYADFFSIGTNDLTGYVMAADRGNADVSYLYSTYDPAVLRAVKHIIACASKHNIKCGMCGEAAADKKLLPLLVSFGLDEFSVNPSSVLSVRAELAGLNKAECDKLAEKVLMCETEQEVLKCLSAQ